MKKADTKSEFIPLLGPILLPLIFFWRELTGLNVFAGFDFTHLILPFHHYARDAYSHGFLPEWNPFMFGGFPQIAEGEGGFFYPGNWMMLASGDQSVLLSWNVVLHLILTGCLMYMYLRNRGATRATSGWLSIIYQFLPGLILRMETVGLFQAVCWLPGFFWMLERSVNSAITGKDLKSALKSGWHRWMLYASVIVAFMLLAGSSQIAFYAMVGGFLYLCGFSLSGPHPGRRAGWAGAIFVSITIFSVVLSAVQLIPTALFSELSWRVNEAGYSYYRIGTWITLPRLSSLFMFPAVNDTSEILYYVTSLGYIGLLPLLLVGVAINRYKRFMNPLLPPFFLLFFGLMLSFGLNFFINEDLIVFPGFNLFRAMGRMILPTVIALFAIAAMGLDSLFQLTRNVKNGKVCLHGIYGTVIISVILLVWLIFFENGNHPGLFIPGLAGLVVLSVLVAAFLAGFFRKPNKNWLIGLLAAWFTIHFVMLIPLKSAITMNRSAFVRMLGEITQNDGIYRNQDFEYAWPRVLISYEENVWEPLLERISTKPFSTGDRLPIPATGNEITMGKIGVLNAYTPLVTDRWHEVAREYAARGLDDIEIASDRLVKVLALMRASAIIAPGTFHGGDGFSEVSTRILDMFPEGWHVLSTPEPVPYVSIPGYIEGWDENHWEWFKYWITQEDYETGDWVCVEVDETFEFPEGFQWGDVLTPVEEFQPAIPAIGGNELDPELSHELTAITRDIRGAPILYITVNTDEPCWVIVRESNMPGWTATVDRETVQIATADYLFMGIPVPEGQHEIRLEYKTPGLATGGWISGIGWLIFLITMVFPVVFRAKKS